MTATQADSACRLWHDLNVDKERPGASPPCSSAGTRCRGSLVRRHRPKGEPRRALPGRPPRREVPHEREAAEAPVPVQDLPAEKQAVRLRAPHRGHVHLVQRHAAGVDERVAARRDPPRESEGTTHDELGQFPHLLGAHPAPARAGGGAARLGQAPPQVGRHALVRHGTERFGLPVVIVVVDVPMHERTSLVDGVVRVLLPVSPQLLLQQLDVPPEVVRAEVRQQGALVVRVPQVERRRGGEGQRRPAAEDYRVVVHLQRGGTLALVDPRSLPAFYFHPERQPHVREGVVAVHPPLLQVRQQFVGIQQEREAGSSRLHYRVAEIPRQLMPQARVAGRQHHAVAAFRSAPTPDRQFEAALGLVALATEVTFADVSTIPNTPLDSIASHILFPAPLLEQTTEPSLSVRNSTPRSSNHARCLAGGKPFVSSDVISFRPRGYPSFSSSLGLLDVSWRMPPPPPCRASPMALNAPPVASYTLTSTESEIEDEISLSLSWSASAIVAAANTPLDPPPTTAMRYLFSGGGDGGGGGGGGGERAEKAHADDPRRP
eukprot:CAMPEP_0172546266 /NCGR_PEP_ID=MMETSP1067-20121228/16054_1 /TAXON_ID=265564 ORGANISM="Thalassiosira punctigera, Strain Tpunct2005C2" /NCGR_SAMPLE_ID=MMETSP1067 /ASSEMBLY_ACC=CAM_ASM_000444 /LENGTH=546 /DNA_ID=CAMNT_0013333167 /DNA_START=301 /DNA_END=1940 /DNA_ORIENTATION=-